ncbi:glycosyltransferase [Qipengyuania aurantiaca]|uniref:Glycosyltransferase n=1 Tax=Qipengyuania aurantiaca TaxID=2867233 RepID=A0ABX8ZUR7_9SPHN|nr:glycosyltransferase family 2 protein [Qipengyuania aurantiaca]QZD90888.1 glycosyltransferase [Qipengyuania aurantiaca]
MDIPKVSIILPVYGVEEYLRECLDSILSQDYTDFEVIAVNDCSPDKSLEILREYAAQDRRICVENLPKNVGLGRARNAGFGKARGEYVWFIDSDDRLLPQALTLLIGRVEDTHADVTICGWLRSYPDGTVEKPLALLHLSNAPDEFTVASYPQILQVFHVAWNKIVKREILRNHSIDFEEGWYEDIDFTYPLLARAASISTLPEPCVSYRQERQGSILATRSDRHFEVFDHWERALGRLEGAEFDHIRSLLVPRLIDSLLAILFHPGRLPSRDTRRFLKQSSSFIQRWQSTVTSVGSLDRAAVNWMKRGKVRLLYLLWRLRRLALRAKLEMNSRFR